MQHSTNRVSMKSCRRKHLTDEDNIYYLGCCVGKHRTRRNRRKSKVVVLDTTNQSTTD